MLLFYYLTVSDAKGHFSELGLIIDNDLMTFRTIPERLLSFC